LRPPGSAGAGLSITLGDGDDGVVDEVDWRPAERFGVALSANNRRI